MKLNLDAHIVEIPCSACGKKIKETLGRLQSNPTLTCTCGATTKVDSTGFNQGLADINKSLDGFGKSLGKLGK